MPFPFVRDAAGRCMVVVAPPLDVLGFFAAEARVREDLAVALFGVFFAPDVAEPDFFALDGVERDVPLFALVDAFRADALTLVADLPASAMPAHPPRLRARTRCPVSS